MSTEVWTATNGYSDSNIIGRGGSSTVYKVFHILDILILSGVV